ncbi:MAG: DUF3429 domain-containing protein [Rhodobacteraceae bacterium]|nr:DUF3429 domain-containing protein [Paracoccaceae bacterium]
MKDTGAYRQRVPRGLIGLGLAGLAPFAWGALTGLAPPLFDLGQRLLGPRFVGLHVQVFYGAIVLAFLSGVLWGFASRSDSQAPTRFHALAVLPALWAFLFVGGGADRAAWVLVVGFLGLLGLDRYFSLHGLTPGWWMEASTLRTALIVACLTLGLLT